MFIIYLSLCWTSCIKQTSLYHTTLTSISVLPFHLRQELNGLFPSGIQTKILCYLSFPHTNNTCPAHSISIYLTNLSLAQSTRNESFLFRNFSHQPVTVCFHRSKHVSPENHNILNFRNMNYIEWYCKISILDLKN